MLDKKVIKRNENIEKGYYEIIETPFHYMESIPYTKIGNGEKTFVLSAGLHGNEHKGIKIAINFIEELKNRELDGQVLVLPCLNPTGLRGNSRYPMTNNTTLNADDPNRSFPDISNIEPENNTEVFYKKVYDIISSQADYYIDLHCFPGTSIPHVIRDPIYCEENFSEYQDVNNKMDTMVDNLCIGQVWTEIPKEKDIQREEIDYYYNLSFSTMRLLIKDKVPSLTLEVGPESSVNKDMEDYVERGILNILSKIGFLDEKTQDLKKYDFNLNDKNLEHKYIRNTKSGMIYPNSNIKPGDRVNKGDKLFEVKDMYGKIIETYYAEKELILLGYFPSMLSEVKDISCCVAIVEDCDIVKTVKVN